jgi:beta-mannosidase
MKMIKVQKIELSQNWKLYNPNKSINMDVEVPGTVYEALLKHHVIEDPFYGLNEREVKWVYESEWIYETHFDLEPEFLSFDKIKLQFQGLDTVAEIYFNDEFLGVTDNMFVSYDYEVQSKLREKNNELKIIFLSSITQIQKLVEKHKIRLRNFQTEIEIPYLRKAQYSFGWDWGPNLPDIGPWRPINLIGHNGVIIESVNVIQDFSYKSSPEETSEFNRNLIEKVKLCIEIEIDSNLEKLKSGSYSLSCTIIEPDSNRIIKIVQIDSITQTLEFEIYNPLLWWIHELGTPYLYELVIDLHNENNIDERRIKIGIRDIELIRTPDEWGESFYFRLNGVPIFAKGANWVPIDSLIPRGKKKGLYETLLNDVKNANMNFIRVWGGGIYEDDMFYKTCDKLGILVWQDFPFACSLYPIHPEFFESVKIEAIQNIKRLRSHPSLAIWCGNNEIEQLWFRNITLAQLKDEKLIKKYEEGYLTLFKELIPNLIDHYDKQRAYWPSSALDRWEGKKELSKNPNGPNEGDSHFWKVWHSGASFKAYSKFNSRFMSEFGFESFPSMKTIRSFCPPNQFDFNSPIMKNHQKNDAGNQKIMKYMKRRFNIPKRFERQVIISQITQAEAIEYGVEHWRRNRNNFHCMGSIYWQLNDCWPVASWSSIDYFGRWKTLHYYAKRFFNPILPSLVINKNSLEFWVVNDCLKEKNVEFNWKLYDSRGNLMKKNSYLAIVSSCISTKITEVKLNEIFNVDESLENKIIFYELKEKSDGMRLLCKGFKLFDDPKRFPVSNPGLSMKFLDLMENQGELSIQVELTADKIALYVYFDSNNFDFIASDNFFPMEPGEKRIILFTILKPLDTKTHIDMELIRSDLKSFSLYDLLQ